MKISRSKMTARQKPRILLQFTVSYLILMLIPIAMGAISYGGSFSSMKKQLLHSNNLILENVMYSLEGSLNSIQDFASSIRGMNYIDRVLQYPNQSRLDLYDLQQAARYLPAYNDSMLYVNSYYLYSKRSQLLLAPHQVFLDLDQYFDYFWGKESASYALWKKQLLDSSPFTSPIVIFPIEGGENAVYYQLPYAGAELNTDGKILFKLNTAQISGSLGQVFELGAQFFYLADGSGAVLLSSGIETAHLNSAQFPETEEETAMVNLNGEQILLTRCHSAQYGLDLVVGIPRRYIFTSCLQSMRINLIGILILIAAGVALIFASYRYNHRPLTQIAHALPPADALPSAPNSSRKTRNGLWKLAGSLWTVSQKNASMEQQLQDQELRLREAFLMQLEFGGVLDETRLTQNLARFHLPFTLGCVCRGIYLRTREDLQLPLREELTAGLCHFLPTLHAGHWLDAQHLSLLCMESAGISAEEVLKQLYYHIKEQYGLDIRIYAGTPRPLSGISRSFTEARSLIQNAADISDRFLYLFDAGLPNTDGYRYAVQQEERLIEAADAGNQAFVQKQLQQIYNENFSKRQLSPFMRNLLYYRMVGTLFTFKYGHSVSGIPPDFPKWSPDEFFAYLHEQYTLICQEALTMQIKKQGQTEKNIVTYLNEHYRDSSLSLSTLSLEFGMTEIYLSSLIRKLLGENFQSYVEKLRIRDANRMLEEQKLPVNQIGMLVGYENANSFSRAYKRIMGYSPSQHVKYHSPKKE